MRKTIEILVAVCAVATMAVADYTPMSVENSAGASPVVLAAEVNGDITLANDETIDNATDSAVQITFDDDAALLGTLKLESENAAGNMADSDELRVDFAAQNDATQEVTYARIVADATDVTDTTEDGTAEIWVMVNGTLTKVFSVTATGLDGELIQADTIDDDSIDFADVTLADMSGSFTDANAAFSISNLVCAGAAITFSALPTSTNGLPSGGLWNSSGTVSIYVP